MDTVLRPITPAELDAFVLADSYGFGFRHEPSEEQDAWIAADLDRTVAAVDADEIVGTGRNYSLELTMPGGAVIPAGGVSWISVRPTHRRRGILRSIMSYLADESAARGESVSILLASEGGIYERFGYGVATRHIGIELERRAIAFRAPPSARGRVRMVEPHENAKLAPEVFDRVRRARSGAVSRPESWWTGEWAPKESVKQRFDVVFEIDGRVDGFAVYGIEGGWDLNRPAKTVVVRDLVAATPEAEAALWRFLCNVDLTTKVTAIRVPVDLELPWLLTDGRQVRTTMLSDFLWLRVIDVAAFLGARTYAASGRLVLDVVDESRPDGAAAGRFLLDAGTDGAACTRTVGDPDLVLDVAGLGAISLGGISPTVLARAGRIDERTPGAAALAARLFATEREPYTFTWF